MNESTFELKLQIGAPERKNAKEDRPVFKLGSSSKRIFFFPPLLDITMRKLTQSDDKSKIWYFLNWFLWLYVTEYFSALLDITMRKMTQSDDKSKKWHFINGFGYIKQDIFQRYSIAQWENDTKWQQIEIVLMSSMPWRQITTYNRAICHPPYCLKRPHNGFKKKSEGSFKTLWAITSV